MQHKKRRSILATTLRSNGKTAESNFIKDVASKVERVKQHDETRLEYMILMMELKQQRREGQEE